MSLSKGLLTRCFGAILFMTSVLVMAQEVPVHQFVDQNGKAWQLVTETNLQRYSWGCQDTPGCVVLGFTDQKAHVVKVLWLVPDGMDDQRTTVLHELQHVVLGDKHVGEQRAEHEHIHRVSRPLTQLLRDRRNEPLVRWLFLEGR